MEQGKAFSEKKEGCSEKSLCFRVNLYMILPMFHVKRICAMSSSKRRRRAINRAPESGGMYEKNLCLL